MTTKQPTKCYLLNKRQRGLVIRALSQNPFAFRRLTRLANHIGKVLENQSGEERRMVLEIMKHIFCQDCGERHDDAALSIPIEKRCRCVMWCDE